MKNARPRNALPRRVAIRAGAAVLAAAALSVTITPSAAAAPAAAATAAAAERGADGARLAALRSLTDSRAATWGQARIVENGRTVWKGTAGVSRLGTGAPVNPDGRFRIGSITKTFTATAVLQLVGEGRIGLDDPVENHLPGVLPNGGGITVRQLLNHTSGLHDYTENPKYGYGSERWVRIDRWLSHSAKGIVAEATAKPPYFAPGEGWRYSNTNYTVAGMLIEKVTGRPWNKEVERRIVHPLGLRGTSMPHTSPLLPGPHARSYTELPSGPADTTLINPSVAGAGGAGISTTADLARFHSALLGGRLLRPAELTEMKRTVDTRLGIEYGLGIQRMDDLDHLGCGKVWGHGGFIQGNLAYLFGDEQGRRQSVSAAGLYGKQDLTAVGKKLSETGKCGTNGRGTPR
ncbi:serine hydrolase domain-containing protein [Streptomyces sp. CAU 1734]|uniref:serine hydrolase domain-containing protein n=1 Tax=Streptomyces sp. CAU 1734 TaxID=3140360 RepID=UPI003260912D